MRPADNISMHEMALDCLDRIWLPCGEAARLQATWNARSLEETTAAAEQVGCQVSYVDLPEKVSGFAQVIEGQTHIVLNRAKPRIDLEYTLPHELGHYVLHLSPSRNMEESEFQVSGTKEFEANLFAVTWIARRGTDLRQNEVLRQNEEALVTMFSCLFVTLLLGLLALVSYTDSKLFPAQGSSLRESR